MQSPIYLTVSGLNPRVLLVQQSLDPGLVSFDRSMLPKWRHMSSQWGRYVECY
jgi:hypothetical protein